MEMTEGEKFRGYVVERLIGKGGYGAVYKVRHQVMDTPFALKVLDPTVADANPEYVRRFVREAKLASRLHHPTLVAVHDAGYDEERGIYYIVMDYVQGSTLREAIALGGAMDCKEAVRIIGHVASALDAAGVLGMVHRDIKPENIILTHDGPVKLIDLGVAKAGCGIDSVRTMANTVFGTPGYMSPEQAADSSTVDVRSDIYSLGVVFYEMLCGRSPYASRSSDKIVQELQKSLPATDILRGDSIKDIISTISEAKSAGLTPEDLALIAKQNLEDSEVLSQAISPLLKEVVPRKFKESYEKAYQPIYEILKDYGDARPILPRVERNIGSLARDLKEAIDTAFELDKVTPI